MSATTFEVEGDVLVPRSVAGGLQAAAADLPPGAYTTLRTYEGSRVLRLRQHVARLSESLTLQGRQGSIDETRVRRAVSAALTATGHAESRLRLTLAPPRFFVSVEAYLALPEAFYREGVACVTVPLRRANPHAKDTTFAATAATVYRALPPSVHEGLMVGEDGALLEGLSSNFFAVREARLWTEGERVLLGVTRSLVLEVASGVVPVSMTAVRRSELEAVTECFITSASRGILPVVAIDGVAVGSGRPGPVTRSLTERFQELVEREAETVF